MRIINTFDGNVGVVHFRLGSVDADYKCFVKPPVRPFEYEDSVIPQAIVTLDFADSREIDNFIELLMRFRDETSRRIGYWK